MPDRRIQRQAGRSRHRAWIYKNVPTTASDGQQVESGKLQMERWVTIRPLRGSERPLAEQQSADYTHLIELWNDDLARTIQPEWWFVNKTDGTRYDVVRIYDPGQDGERLEAECNQRI